MRLLRTNVFQRISLFCKQGQFQPLIICRNFVLPSDMALSNFTGQRKNLRGKTVKIVFLS